MNNEKFTEADFVEIKRKVEEVYSSIQKFDHFLNSEKGLPIGIRIYAELWPAHMRETISPEQAKIWIEVMKILEWEFSGAHSESEAYKNG